MGLQEYLLSQLKRTNPSGYKAYTEIRQSGKDPYEVMSGMYSKGEINDSQLDTIAKQMRLFGVKISEEDINRIKSGKKADMDMKKKYDYTGLF